jgi:hypothetical protein
LSQRTQVRCLHRKITLHKSSEFHLKRFYSRSSIRRHTVTTSVRLRTFRMLTPPRGMPGLIFYQAANTACGHPHAALSANHLSYYHELVRHRSLLSKIFQGPFTSSEIGAKRRAGPHILRCQAANAARRHPHVALSAKLPFGAPRDSLFPLHLLRHSARLPTMERRIHSAASCALCPPAG